MTRLSIFLPIVLLVCLFSVSEQAAIKHKAIKKHHKQPIVTCQSSSLISASPDLVSIYLEIKHRWEKQHPDYILKPTCVYRTPPQQLIVFRRHRSERDGYIRLSNHNYLPSRAIDVAIYRKSSGKNIDSLVARHKFSKKKLIALYHDYGVIAESMGLTWGGRWTSLNDVYHIELKMLSVQDPFNPAVFTPNFSLKSTP